MGISFFSFVFECYPWKQGDRGVKETTQTHEAIGEG